MATIHVPGGGHVAPAANSGFQWLPYSDDKKKHVIERALFILRHNVRGMKPCNACFRRLPGGRSFDDVLDDPSVFISFDPQTTKGTFGATLGKEVTITDFSIGIGRWTVAATLVHEFAHVNGAPGDTHDAEGTLLCCGFSALHDPDIIGAGGVQEPQNRYA
jgi:hypothetical protein